MVERFVLAFFAKARKSKGGVVLTVVGVFLLFATLIIGLVSVVGDALLLITGVGATVRFMETGLGVSVGFVVSVLVILLGVAFMNRASPQATASATVIQEIGTAQAERDRELERANTRLRKTEQENKRLRAFLDDPDAKRLREEEMLRKRCGQLAVEARDFARAYRNRYAERQEAVERYRLRHYAEVEKARAELDAREWITDQEHDDLTLSPQDDLQKIERMANTLVRIAVKQ